MMRYLRWPLALKNSTKRWPPRSSSIPGQALSEDSEGLLEREKRNVTPPLRERRRLFSLGKTRRYVALGGLATLLLLLLAYTFSSKPQSRSRPSDASKRHAQKLHLAIPTREPSLELCKTVLSAEVLHYSTPTIVRWDDPDQDPRASAQRRMTAVRDYLEKLTKDHENDTVVLLGSASTYFQLRPEVLLKRYYEINRRGNERLATSIPSEKMQESSVEQTVLFSASSECGVASFDAAKCSRFPKSLFNGRSPKMNAPRYLSQDLVIGRAKDLHEIYRRAVAVIERGPAFTSELAIFSEIFFSQEHQRSLLKSKSLSWSQRFRGLFIGSYSHGPLAGRNSTIHGKRHADEFNIGLDYSGELSMDLSKGPESFTLTQHKTLPEDVIFSMPPFWTTTGQGLPSDKTWTDLDLFTNVHTQSVPATIHNNLADSPDIRQKHWASLWLRPFSRTLLDAYMDVPVMPLASLVDNGGVEQLFWSTTTGEKAGVKDADGKWYRWNDICSGEKLAGELFGDGLGEWKAARS